MIKCQSFLWWIVLSLRRINESYWDELFSDQHLIPINSICQETYGDRSHCEDVNKARLTGSIILLYSSAMFKVVEGRYSVFDLMSPRPTKEKQKLGEELDHGMLAKAIW